MKLYEKTDVTIGQRWPDAFIARGRIEADYGKWVPYMLIRLPWPVRRRMRDYEAQSPREIGQLWTAFPTWVWHAGKGPVEPSIWFFWTYVEPL